MEKQNPFLQFWQRAWWSKLITVAAGLFIFFIILGIFSPEGQRSAKEGFETGKEVASETSPSPSDSLEEISKVEQLPVPEATPQRKIVKGSTPKGEEFYEKVEVLRRQGKVNGELCTEFESDAVVDVNPDSPAVQLSLMYPSITGSIDNQDKALIMNDFKAIKALAEQDKSLLLPDYGTLRLFVLTFHDNSCIAKGDLQQLMIDPEPQWLDWK